ncbi:MAG: ABC transporter substrate-binding protein [Ruminococcus flavefaciens]|nr:ABC transporter substrate-binding protein [Ruminococcus flavefaciens]MCM1229493.1 ABC transporter substrate-binding protein [Ruminococcus flavefaciens]
MSNLKKISLLLSIIMCTAVLPSCGNDDKGDGTGHMYNAPLLENPKSLDPQFACDSSSNTVIKNLYSGLMQIDGNGNVVCCNAESYTVSDDGLIYTFRLRDDNFWFFDTNNDDVISEDEYFPVTADDYVFALQRVLNPEMKSPYAEDFICIMGASAVLYNNEPVSSAEILAVDDHTLMVVLERPNAEFLNLMASPATYPCNEEFFYSTKGRYGLDDRSVMSNGAFYVRQWFYDPYGNNNILYMKRNDANWSETFDIAPSFLSFTIERSEEDIRDIFRKDQIECFTTLDSTLYNTGKYSVNAVSATTLGLIFNPKDKYYSNDNMRKALALATDRDSLGKELDSDLQIAGGIIPPAVKFHGRSYRELVSDKQFASYNKDEALDCYNTAKKELKTESFESVRILVNAETVNSAYLHTLVQKWQEIFGFYIGIEDVTPEEFYQRISDGDYSIALYPVKGRSASGISVIREFEKTDCLAGTVPEEKLSPSLMCCSSFEEVVEAYTSAEKKILESNLFIPLFYKNSYLIADKDNENIIYDPFTEAVDYRLALNYD